MPIVEDYGPQTDPKNPQSPRKPPWLKVRAPLGAEVEEIKNVLDGFSLHTVCEEALCPNVKECMSSGTATFLILGDSCTRSCGFCAVKKCNSGAAPPSADYREADRVALAALRLRLKHVVVTSVTRDDLSDGGAGLFAAVVKRIKELCSMATVEVLIPDFQGSTEALDTVLDAHPDVLNHNLETVARLYPTVRPQAEYEQSLGILRSVKEQCRSILTKSGLMVGLGEEWGEIWQAITDLRSVGCDLLTIGQYLSPKESNLPVRKYYHPDEFYALKRGSEGMGFKAVAAGPLVRSSHRAGEMISHG